MRFYFFVVVMIFSVSSLAEKRNYCSDFFQSPTVSSKGLLGPRPKSEPGPTFEVDGRDVESAYLHFAKHTALVLIDMSVNPSPKKELEAQLAKVHFNERGGQIRWDLNGGKMNCHAYASFLAKVPGITKRMWIDPTENGYKGFEEILKEFFKVVGVYKKESLPQAIHQTVKPGDLILVYDKTELVHTGFALDEKTANGDLIIQSKHGHDAVVDTPIDLFLDLYPSYKVQIYRPKID